MKKAIVLVCAALLLAFTLVGCGKKTCAFCDEEKSCKTMKVAGEKIDYCKDCKAEAEAVKALGKLMK